jgi:hypothetical protein
MNINDVRIDIGDFVYRSIQFSIRDSARYSVRDSVLWSVRYSVENSSTGTSGDGVYIWCSMRDSMKSSYESN